MTVLVDPKTREVIGQVLAENPDGTVTVLKRGGSTEILHPMYFTCVSIGS